MKKLDQTKTSVLNEGPRTKKTTSKSRFRRVNDWLHLWLGLISGIVVLVVCLTGCIWCFNVEIMWLLEPEKRVEKRNAPVLTPSQVAKIAEASAPGKVDYAYYLQGRTIEVMVASDSSQYELQLHPYTGKIVEQKKRIEGETDFFSFILNGHRFLWLPYEIGRPIVNYSTMIFVVLLITGLIWWYPKKWNKSTREKSFSIKWGASFKRVNLDLHNVLGFYAMLFLLCIALTGMVWGIAWYSEGMYWLTSGGKSLPPWTEAVSDSLQSDRQVPVLHTLDHTWAQVASAHPSAEGFYYAFPDTTKATSGISITVYPSSSKFYGTQTYHFDRYTLAMLPPNEIYGKPFEGASFATQLRKLNYDIHVGSVLGFPGKVLAFLSSLIGASLPITGFLIWWGRKFNKKKSKSSRKSKIGKVDATVEMVY